MAIIGIDLGTTNSACALWKDGKVELIPNRLGEWLTPSVVSVDKEGKLTVGKTARELSHKYPNETASVFKRHMGSERLLKIGSKQYSPAELSALVLTSLKEDAETYLQTKITEVVISVPAYFNDTQRKDTILAGELAGLNVSCLINEPTAAAIAYGLHEKPEFTQFIILDLGGGTFDVSIMEFFDDTLEVHATGGDNFLGGEDFLEVLVNLYLSQTNIQRESVDKSSLQYIYTAMEAVKKQFNTDDSILVKPFIKQQKEEVILKLDDFTKASEPLMSRIRKPIELALLDSKINLDEIDAIILAGGSTRMKTFRSLVAKLFKKMPSTYHNPDLTIAMGAAIQAGLKYKDSQLKDVVLTDVCPYSLGVGILNEGDTTGRQGLLFSPILERNTIVPASRVQSYCTTKNMQTTIQFKVYQGESRLVKNNIQIGICDIKVPKGPAGSENVEVRFSYDTNGILEIDATSCSTGETDQLTIINSHKSLSEKDIIESKEKLSKLKFHPRDQEVNIELVARAERLFESRLGPERANIQEQLKEFELVLESQNNEYIQEGQKLFDEYLKAIESEKVF